MVSVRLLGQAATATPAKVTVAKLATVKVVKGKKATIKPKVKVSGQAKLKKAVLTVKRGSKTIAKNKASVKLAVGKIVARAGVGTPVSCKVGAVSPLASSSGGLPTTYMLFDMECTGTALPTPISVSSIMCAMSSCSALKLSWSYLPAWGSTFTATHTPTEDVYAAAPGSPVTKYSKVKTATRTQTLLVKAKKK
jgi:hypothetical protein